MSELPWWKAIEGSELAQGDILPGCLVPMIPDDFDPDGQPFDLRTKPGRFVVMSQTCDLLNMKTGAVALCPIWTVAEFEAGNPIFAKKGIWEEVRKGRREGLYMLASPTQPTVSRETLLVNFREIHSLPIGYLQRHAAAVGSRWRLNSPYLEHFSQAFARFFMRVGLPSTLPPFTD